MQNSNKKPNWLVLHEKSQERALQFMKDPDLDDYAKDYVKNSLSENTLRAYAADLKVFRLWCEDRHFDYLPATPNVIANFLAAQAKSKEPILKASSISRRLAAIRFVHKMAGLSTLPTDDELVRQTLKGIMREKLAAPDQKSPSTNDLIALMIEQIDDTTLMGLRDKALLLLGFAGGFRRSELVKVKLDDLKIHAQGMDVFIPTSKTDQTGHGKTKPILRGKDYCPVQSVQDWIAAAGLTEGYLFRGIIHKTGQLRPSYNDPKKPDLSDQTVALVVKKYSALIGLDHENYAGHSLRAGFVTAARKNGASYEQIMEVTGHKDLKSLIMYFRNIDQYKDHAGEGLL